MRRLSVQRLGRVDYEAALAIQKATELAVKNGVQLDTLLLLEHPHTFTIGRRGDSASVLLDPEQLGSRNVTLFETNRGGKVTYHGVGQVVGYPIINLSPDREDVHRYVRDLEEVLIQDHGGLWYRRLSNRGLDRSSHAARESCSHRRTHRALGYYTWFRAQRKHRSQFLQSDHCMRRRTGYFNGRVAGN